MEQFWKALITGLSPEKPSEVDLWWKVPLTILAVFVFLTIF